MVNTEPQSIGDRLGIARRMATELSGRELSVLARLSGPHVRNIEHREGGIETTTATKLCRVLGISVGWLVTGEGRPPAPSKVKATVEAARDEFFRVHGYRAKGADSRAAKAAASRLTAERAA